MFDYQKIIPKSIGFSSRPYSNGHKITKPVYQLVDYVSTKIPLISHSNPVEMDKSNLVGYLSRIF